MTAQLKPKQQKALDALIESGSVQEAADAAGVSRRTVTTWIREPGFLDALRAAEDGSVKAMARRLLAVSDQAITVVVELMGDPKASAAVRLRAADTVLERLLQLRELEITEDRLAAIEAALALRGGRR